MPQFHSCQHQISPKNQHNAKQRGDEKNTYNRVT